MPAECQLGQPKPCQGAPASPAGCRRRPLRRPPPKSPPASAGRSAPRRPPGPGTRPGRRRGQTPPPLGRSTNSSPVPAAAAPQGRAPALSGAPWRRPAGACLGGGKSRFGAAWPGVRGCARHGWLPSAWRRQPAAGARARPAVTSPHECTLHKEAQRHTKNQRSHNTQHTKAERAGPPTRKNSRRMSWLAGGSRRCRAASWPVCRPRKRAAHMPTPRSAGVHAPAAAPPCSGERRRLVAACSGEGARHSRR